MNCLNFREIIDLDISYESSNSRQFTCNVVPYLIPKTATNFKSVVCFCGQLYYCVRNVWLLQAQWKNMVFYTDPRKKLNWRHYKVICCGIYKAVCYPTWSLIFVIYDTPKVAIFGALTRYIYSDFFLSTHVGVAFLLRLNTADGIQPWTLSLSDDVKSICQ